MDFFIEIHGDIVNYNYVAVAYRNVFTLWDNTVYSTQLKYILMELLL